MGAQDESAQIAAYSYAGALIEELARAGVRHACVCPGSRSTPLAFSLAANDAIKVWMHVDERSASYFALGLARASGTPVVLVCTSGTAAANFLPAVVEARYGRVPLIVLTADRPPELRDVGAAQAIDQIHLYGNNVKWFVEMALPEASAGMIRYARATGARAAATALEEPAGPVHLNLPFREPLVPPTTSLPLAGGDSTSGDEGQHAMVMSGPRRAQDGDVRALAESLAADVMAEAGGRRGLIVCGPQPDSGLAGAVTRLGAMLGYPVLADPLSGVRCGRHGRTMVCDAYDAFLRTLSDTQAAALTPDVVLRFGAIPTSKALLTFLNRAGRQILVDGAGGWQDPALRADTVVHADSLLLCDALIATFEHRLPDACALTRTHNEGWLAAWLRADRRARGAIESYLDDLDEPFEGKVFAELARLLPDDATLFAGNSMPVRDLDTFFPGGDRHVRFLANRGANGIDGVVSSALGVAANGDGPLVLVIGDLSFYHDLNGLLAARKYPIDAMIVLLNNDGGGIFSFLPQANYPERFEQLFGTPTGLDFRPAVEMYGCRFERVETWPAFRAAVSKSLASRGVGVIEVRTDRARNVALHREVTQAVAEAVWDE